MMSKQVNVYNREITPYYTAIMDNKHTKAIGHPNMGSGLWVMKMRPVYTTSDK